MRKFDGKNPGGLKALYIILKSDIDTLPAAQALLISSDIITTGNWEQVVFLPDSAGHDESRADDAQGNSYSQKISCLINMDRLEISQAQYNYENRDIIALATDHNGTTRVIGTLDQPARLNYDLTKGTALAGSANAYTMTITAITTAPAAYYTGAISSAV